MESPISYDKTKRSKDAKALKNHYSIPFGKIQIRDKRKQRRSHTPGEEKLGTPT